MVGLKPYQIAARGIARTFQNIRLFPELSVTDNVKIAARLHQRLLRAHWIACVPSGRRYHDAAVVRCNVNFGDPHIQAYCSVMRGGRLVTQYDDAAIPCGHDGAGWSAPVKTLN